MRALEGSPSQLRVPAELRPGQNGRRQHTFLKFFPCLSQILCSPTLGTLGPFWGQGRPLPSFQGHVLLHLLSALGFLATLPG